MNKSIQAFCLLATIFMIQFHENEGCNSPTPIGERANSFFRSCHYDWGSTATCCQQVARRYETASHVQECVDGGYAKKRKYSNFGHFEFVFPRLSIKFMF